MSELQGLQSSIDSIEQAGVQIVAISSDDRQNAEKTAKTELLDFPVLADGDLRVIDAYGVRHEGAQMFGRGIARPAAFLIDEEGVIRWRFVTDNWRVRVRPEQVLAAIDELGPAAAPPG